MYFLYESIIFIRFSNFLLGLYDSSVSFDIKAFCGDLMIQKNVYQKKQMIRLLLLGIYAQAIFQTASNYLSFWFWFNLDFKLISHPFFVIPQELTTTNYEES